MSSINKHCHLMHWTKFSLVLISLFLVVDRRCLPHREKKILSSNSSQENKWAHFPKNHKPKGTCWNHDLHLSQHQSSLLVCLDWGHPVAGSITCSYREHREEEWAVNCCADFSLLLLWKCWSSCLRCFDQWLRVCTTVLLVWQHRACLFEVFLLWKMERRWELAHFLWCYMFPLVFTWMLIGSKYLAATKGEK